MTIGLITFSTALAGWSQPVMAQFVMAQFVVAQFGGTKNFWTDLILVAVLMGGAVYAVCRSSRRY